LASQKIRMGVSGFARWILRNDGSRSAEELASHVFRLGVVSLLPEVALTAGLAPLFATRPDHAIDPVVGGCWVDQEKVVALFRCYSYLLSLGVFDSVFGVKHLPDFGVLFSPFLDVLMQFSGRNEDTTMDYFRELCAAGCIADPRRFFLVSVVRIHLASGSDVSGMGSLIGKVMGNPEFEPRGFLIAALELKTERPDVAEGAPVGMLSAVYDLIDGLREDNRVTVADCLNEGVVAGFRACFGTAASVFVELLKKLRSL